MERHAGRGEVRSVLRRVVRPVPAAVQCREIHDSGRRDQCGGHALGLPAWAAIGISSLASIVVAFDFVMDYYGKAAARREDFGLPIYLV